MVIDQVNITVDSLLPSLIYIQFQMFICSFKKCANVYDDHVGNDHLVMWSFGYDHIQNMSFLCISIC